MARVFQAVGCAYAMHLAFAVMALLIARPGATLPPNEALLAELKRVHGLADDSMRRLEEILASSSRIGQGNPAVTRHPATPEECAAKLKAANVSYRGSGL